MKILLEAFLFSLALLVLSTNLMAQEEDFNTGFSLAVPPSPEAASLGQYGAYPVNLASGTPNISIPIYEILSGSLRVPISVDYNASGIRVAQPSGRVGLGWTLRAGGVVTRTMRGLPDEQPGTGFLDAWGSIKDVNLGDIFNDQVLFDRLKAFSEGQMDAEPDQFFYNIINSGGQLMFDNETTPDASGNLNLVPVPFNPIKAVFNKNADDFIIKDANGVVYRFTDIEKTKIDPISRYNMDETIYTSSWFLTSISSADGKDNIYFEYYSKDNMPYIPANYGSSVQLSQTIEKKLPNSHNNESLKENCSYVASKIINDPIAAGSTNYIPQFLHRIRFNGGQVRFEGAPYLTEIFVESIDDHGNVNPEPIKSYYFNFKSYTSPGGDDCQCDGIDIQYKSGHTSETSRKILKSIKESGKGFHNFEYYENALFPHDKSFDQDYWGYFNNAGNSGNFIPSFTAYGYTIGNANRLSDGEAMKAWSLKSIKYPTGGKTVFDFEPHDISYLDKHTDTYSSNTEIQVTGITEIPDYNNKNSKSTIATIIPINDGSEVGNIITDNITAKFTVSIEKLNGINTGEGHGILRDINSGQIISQFNWKHPDNEADLIRTKIDDVELVYGQQYKIEIWSNYNLVKVTASLNVEFHYVSDIHKKVEIGGLRVKSIKNYDQNFDQLSEKNFYYDEPQTFNGHVYEGWSTGKLTSGLEYKVHFEDGGAYYNYRMHNYYVLEGDWYAIFFPKTDYYLVLKSGISPQLGSGVVTYKKVIEVDADKGLDANGKTVSYFSTTEDIVRNHYPYPPSVDNEWKRGQLLKKEIFKYEEGNFKLKEKITNNYRIEGNINFEEIEARKYGFSDLYFDMSNGGNTSYELDQFMMTPINYNSQWLYLESTQIEKINEHNDNVQVTNVAYSYNDKNVKVSEQITHLPDGDKLIQETKYPSDYPIETGEVGANKSRIALDFINEHHILNLPIEQRNYVIERGNTEKKLTDLRLNIYNLGTANFLAPYRSFRWEGNVEVANENELPKATRDGAYVYMHWTTDDLKKVKSYATDNYGNINHIYSNGFSQSYLWSESRQLLAKVDNSDWADFAYTSFESSVKGNWIYNGSGSEVNNHLFGKKAYDVTNGELRKLLSSGQEYILSFWYQGETKPIIDLSLGGQVTLIEDGNTIIGDWKLCKYLIKSSDAITLKNSGFIDELKIKPKDSSLTTYIHEPLVGIKYTSDDNDLPTFFKYGNGFLESIYDHEMNMLRKFEYNFQNK